MPPHLLLLFLLAALVLAPLATASKVVFVEFNPQKCGKEPVIGDGGRAVEALAELPVVQSAASIRDLLAAQVAYYGNIPSAVEIVDKWGCVVDDQTVNHGLATDRGQGRFSFWNIRRNVLWDHPSLGFVNTPLNTDDDIVAFMTEFVAILPWLERNLLPAGQVDVLVSRLLCSLSHPGVSQLSEAQIKALSFHLHFLHTLFHYSNFHHVGIDAFILRLSEAAAAATEEAALISPSQPTKDGVSVAIGAWWRIPILFSPRSSADVDMALLRRSGRIHQWQVDLWYLSSFVSGGLSSKHGYFNSKLALRYVDYSSLFGSLLLKHDAAPSVDAFDGAIEQLPNPWKLFDKTALELVTRVFHQSSMISHDAEYFLKRRINALIRRHFTNTNESVSMRVGDPRLEITETNRRRMAVVAPNYTIGHPSHSFLHSHLRYLAQNSDLALTLVVVRPDRVGRAAFDSQGFQVIESFQNLSDAAKFLSSGDFGIIFYADIGQHSATLVLSNMRLAPIQLCSYGQATSTHGAKIDFFLGSLEVEKTNDDELDENGETRGSSIKSRYSSERVLLLPGLGLHYPLKLGFDSHRIVAALPVTDTIDFIINCPWQSLQVHHPNLVRIRDIAVAAHSLVKALTTPFVRRKIIFRIFSGIESETLQYRNLLKDANHVLDMASLNAVARTCGGGGDTAQCSFPTGLDFSWEIYPLLTYTNFQLALQRGHLTLDSFHVGSSSAIFDSLLFTVPVVTREGKHWCNRVSAAVLRRVKLDVLVTQSNDDFKSLAAELIVDDSRRIAISNHLKSVDFQTLFFNNANDVSSWPVALSYLLKHHYQLVGRRPISWIDILSDRVPDSEPLASCQGFDCQFMEDEFPKIAWDTKFFSENDPLHSSDPGLQHYRALSRV